MQSLLGAVCRVIAKRIYMAALFGINLVWEINEHLSSAERPRGEPTEEEEASKQKQQL
jgi:hypothetical protein